MERLTEYLGGIPHIKRTINGINGKANYLRDFDIEAVRKLAAYEDTGLEPEELLNLKSGVIPEHWGDLFRAECEGRLVVLPCKVGDTVFRIATGHVCGKKRSSYSGEYVIQEFGIKSEYVAGNGIDMFAHMILDDGKPSTSYEIFDSNNIGKTVFLTRAEAEAAMKGVTDDA